MIGSSLGSGGGAGGMKCSSSSSGPGRGGGALRARILRARVPCAAVRRSRPAAWITSGSCVPGPPSNAPRTPSSSNPRIPSTPRVPRASSAPCAFPFPRVSRVPRASPSPSPGAPGAFPSPCAPRVPVVPSSPSGPGVSREPESPCVPSGSSQIPARVWRFPWARFRGPEQVLHILRRRARHILALRPGHRLGRGRGLFEPGDELAPCRVLVALSALRVIPVRHVPTDVQIEACLPR